MAGAIPIAVRLTVSCRPRPPRSGSCQLVLSSCNLPCPAERELALPKDRAPGLEVHAANGNHWA